MNYKVFLLFLFILVIPFSFGQISNQILYTYNWEDAGEATNYTASASWARTQDTVYEQSWAADYDGAAGGDATYTYNNLFNGTGYFACQIRTFLNLESGNDNGEYVCLDYSTDGQNFNLDSGSSGDPLCLDGNDAGEEGNWILRQINITDPNSSIKWRFRANGGNNEDAFSDYTQVICSTQAPDWTTQMSDNPDPVESGKDIKFNATVTDEESDDVYLTVCNATGITNGNCTNSINYLCSAPLSASGSTLECNYTTIGSDYDTGTVTAYGYICDSRLACHSDNSETTTLVNPDLTPDSCPGMITGSDLTFKLESNIIDRTIGGTSACFSFYGAQNGTLDCQGYSIIGKQGYGVEMVWNGTNIPQNMTIVNCTFSNWTYGIRSFAPRSTFRDIDIINVTEYGLYSSVNIARTGSVIVENVNVLYHYGDGGNEAGIYFDNPNSNLTNSTVKQAYQGLVWPTDSGTNMTIKDSYFQGTYVAWEASNIGGLDLNNTLFNNTFNGTMSLGISASEIQNFYEGTHGNYYVNTSNTAYSQTCQDTTPEDGICDKPYDLKNNSICGDTCSAATDYYPLVYGYTGVDDTNPVLHNVSVNDTYPPNFQMATWNVTVTDNQLVDFITFQNNKTGTWSNGTFTEFNLNHAYYEVSEFMYDTYGNHICGRFWANDTTNNWAISSEACIIVDGAPAGDTCTCPGANINHVFNQGDTCIVNSCTAGNISFYGSGYTTCSGIWNIQNIFTNLTNGLLNGTTSCTINLI